MLGCRSPYPSNLRNSDRDILFEGECWNDKLIDAVNTLLSGHLGTADVQSRLCCDRVQQDSIK